MESTCEDDAKGKFDRFLYKVCSECASIMLKTEATCANGTSDVQIIVEPLPSVAHYGLFLCQIMHADVNSCPSKLAIFNIFQLVSH